MTSHVTLMYAILSFGYIRYDLQRHVYLTAFPFSLVQVGSAGPYHWIFALHFYISTILCFPSIWIFEHMPTWELGGAAAMVQSKSASFV